ncbi:hypothetical protein PHLCEN_2v9020 [Hermanssonia centrifuga]|uniref:Uncharacterized protein n=1 Tax=Hermanssonia centrifuga TaxID=98765 RepID=A0A2R6NSS5_9APHY|nr:hypothetical protein PHLCEN_2v9020 [Hermanssonia centrifuga]
MGADLDHGPAEEPDVDEEAEDVDVDGGDVEVAASEDGSGGIVHEIQEWCKDSSNILSSYFKIRSGINEFQSPVVPFTVMSRYQEIRRRTFVNRSLYIRNVTLKFIACIFELTDIDYRKNKVVAI